MTPTVLKNLINKSMDFNDSSPIFSRLKTLRHSKRLKERILPFAFSIVSRGRKHDAQPRAHQKGEDGNAAPACGIRSGGDGGRGWRCHIRQRISQGTEFRRHVSLLALVEDIFSGVICTSIVTAMPTSSPVAKRIARDSDRSDNLDLT